MNEEQPKTGWERIQEALALADVERGRPDEITKWLADKKATSELYGEK